MFLKTPDQTRPDQTRPDHLLLAVAKLGVLVVGSEQMKTPELINCPGWVVVVVVVVVQHDNGFILEPNTTPIWVPGLPGLRTADRK